MGQVWDLQRTGVGESQEMSAGHGGIPQQELAQEDGH